MHFNWEELTPEEEEKYIQDIASKIVQLGLEVPASIFLEIFKPLGYIFSSTSLLIGAPILELIGLKGYDYVQLFRKSENIDKLIKKIHAV